MPIYQELPKIDNPTFYSASAANHGANEEPIGGQGVIIEMDESKFGQTKNNLRGTRVEGAETMLHSDEWAVYNTDCLEQLGYLHESVNHYIEYVHEGDWFLL
ncbi:hypothetical protein BDC45DRAFT_575362 [Circinella umbellata]|nr:hypothetical protein BDC45DRAFT_575362 [Circinella umbellata]